MPQMSGYCKAYLAHDLRQFPGWSEQLPPLVASAGEKAHEKESEYFYLHDDFVVTAGVHRDEKVAFDHITPDWKAFCKTVLNFEVPSTGNSPSL
jgi:hypothetical protein